MIAVSAAPELPVADCWLVVACVVLDEEEEVGGCDGAAEVSDILPAGAVVSFLCSLSA